MERAHTIAGILSAAAETWCRTAHSEITWPVHGRYHCRHCGRTYRVPWGEAAVGRVPAARQVKPSPPIATTFPAAA